MIALVWVGCSGGGPGDGPEAEPPSAGPFFGSRMAADDGGVWIFAPGGGETAELGRWTRHAASLDEGRRVSESEPGDLGGDLAVCGDHLVIGAPDRGDGGAWIVPPGDDAVATQAFAEGFYDLGRAGDGVACGDLGGPGAFDFAVGAPESDVDLPGAGTVAVYGWVDDAPDKAASVDTTWAGASLGGRSTVRVVDVTQDGVDDLIVAGPGSDRVHLLPGPLDGAFYTNAAVTWQGDEGDDTGASFAVGDFDGDGVLDLAIGAPRAGSDRGGVWIVPGPLADAGGLLTSTGRLVYGVSIGSRLGAELVAVPDLDGDGADELLVGAPSAPGAGPDSGAAYLVTSTTWPALPDFDGADAILLPEAAGGRFGSSVAVFDGGLWVGAPDARNGVGAVAVFPSSVRGTTYDADAAQTVEP